MSVYYYSNSSQMALRGDRVELPSGIRAELRGIWLQRGKVMAEVVYPGPAGTACMEMVTLESLIYIPPEQELAERIGADMPPLPEPRPVMAAFERQAALELAVRAHGPDSDPLTLPAHIDNILHTAEAFLAWLNQTSTTNPTEENNPS